MNKIWIVLLLVSTVIGTAVPGIANPQATNNKDIEVNVDGSLWSTNEISQTLQNSGDLINEANDLVALTGDVGAVSEAEADTDVEAESGDANNSGSEEAESGDANANDNYADAHSGDVDAYSGNANNDVHQKNKVYQDAYAKIHNDQTLTQTVTIDEWQKVKVDIDDSAFTEGNELDEGSFILASGDEEVEDNTINVTTE